MKFSNVEPTQTVCDFRGSRERLQENKKRGANAAQNLCLERCKSYEFCFVKNVGSKGLDFRLKRFWLLFTYKHSSTHTSVMINGSSSMFA